MNEAVALLFVVRWFDKKFPIIFAKEYEIETDAVLGIISQFLYTNFILKTIIKMIV